MTMDEQTIAPQRRVDTIEFTSETIKWRDRADTRYQDMFNRRVQQLTNGERSYTLSKRLKHCSQPTYESKVYGHRILWTPIKRRDASIIRIWCVSDHDDVPRRMEQIDKSYSRLRKQSYSDDRNTVGLEAVLQLNEDEMFLADPFSNALLKVYTVNRENVPKLQHGYKPVLQLSRDQIDINSQTGTVLLLGRSGTGKTKIISTRMVSDRESLTVTKQLFVARSRGLCGLMATYQTDQSSEESRQNKQIDIKTLEDFISLMDQAITAKFKRSRRDFTPKYRVDFNYFRDNFFPHMRDKDSPEALIVWTQIRSFIKGSIEAALLGRPLTLEEYLDTNVFGEEGRCRLPVEQRRKAYAMYLAYEKELAGSGMWDDSDRVLDLLIRSQLKKLQPLACCCSIQEGTDYNKVYVDEIQDCTQAEITLFFLAAGLNVQSLFLAGDPAQAVVEGVDFRFEDLRAIPYKLSAGKERLERPFRLIVNYRSHSGILLCAAAVLAKMFAAYPGSAKELPPDTGVFQGPRPAYYQADGYKGAANMLANSARLVIICPDEIQENLSKMGSLNLLLGIREAKGLEFLDIALVDFFSSLSNNDQKAWKQLLSDDSLTDMPYLLPQVETQLKLLYTAMTRSCNRLIFIETMRSEAGDAFFRWLREKQLAEELVIIEGEEEMMTGDESTARGIQLALAAGGVNSISLLQKALECFKRAGNKALIDRTSAQLDAFLLLKDLDECEGILSPSVEEKAAKIIYGLVEGHLLEEARTLCKMIELRSSDPQSFKIHITVKLNI